jgi:hyperosmotically inducible periplasmic protein
MTNVKPYTALFAIGVAMALSGCAGSAKSPDVADNIRHSLDASGMNNVSVSQDREKGVVTLNGHVDTDSQKTEAERLAKTIAVGQVVADQIAVVPPGAASDAKAINSDVDSAIEKNLDAALIQNSLKKQVKFDVKNGVVTLKGEVESQSLRRQAMTVAQGVPNVQQVVNELQIKNQKATSTN